MRNRRAQVVAALSKAREIHKHYAQADAAGKMGKTKRRLQGDVKWHRYWIGVYTAALRELGAER